MREIELKILLNPDQAKHMRSSSEVRALSEGRARTQTLHSVYYDTEDGALRGRRIALRLRRVGRRWIQTVKRAHGEMAHGLSTPDEFETQVTGQNLALERIPDDDLREWLIGEAHRGLAPVVETRFRRTIRVLALPNGARAELALDEGDLIGQEITAPLREAELELLSGTPADLYALAARIFTRPPIRFAETSKSARALALLSPPLPAAPRKARRLVLSAEQSVEQAAIEILGEGLSHYMPNLADLLETELLSGPHQTRVALRRLRSALGALRPALGAARLAHWADRAREIAAVAGRLRDLDVLVEDLALRVAPAGDPGTDKLLAALVAQRVRTRAEVRAALAKPDVTAFGFDLAGFLAGRGWLDPADHGQTLRLAQPLGPYAARILQKRWKAVARYGDRMDELTIDERHEMRKELKKFRYMLDAFRSLYPENQFAVLMRQIKDLQTAFGALNDQAMAEILLTGPDAPAPTDPVVQRAAGRMIGYLSAEAERLWPDAQVGWERLRRTPRPWKAALR